MRYSQIRNALVGTAAVTVFAAFGSACSADVDSSHVPPASDASPETKTTEGGGGYKPADDAKISDCEAGDFGEIEAVITITNGDTKSRSYLITAEAVDTDGNRLAELNAAANSVRPGQRVTTDAFGMLDVDNPPKFTCQLVSVDSFRD